MFFHLEMHIPKNTTKEENYRETIEISAGRIDQIRIFFPWGCANLCGVQIYRYEQQLFPLNRGEYIKGNDVEYIHNLDFELTDEPWELTIKGFNLDDIFEHKPVISVQMNRNKLSKGLDKFLRTLGV